MRRPIQTRERGQAIIMVTLSIILLCGMLGLAVDLGWAYFVRKATQAGADAAALSAARHALSLGVYTCDALGCAGDPGVGCDTVAGPAMLVACQYAQRHGYTAGGENGRQNVLVAAGITTPPPTVPNVAVQYWVTVRITHRLPTLFAAVMGSNSSEYTVAARATGAITEGIVNGGLILINRDQDVSPFTANGTRTGLNLFASGGGTLIAQGGITMASGCAGVASGPSCAGGSYAAEKNNNASIQSPYSYIRNPGRADNTNNWVAAPQNRGDNPAFYDPMKGKPQPPITTATLPRCPILGGVLDGTETPLYVGRGNFYAAQPPGSGETEPRATGGQISVRGDVRFVAGLDCTSGTGSSNNSSFHDAIFWGGLKTISAGQGATLMTFDPGRYVFAGSTPGNNTATPLFDISTGQVTVQSSANVDGYAGNLFIFTAPGYPGLDAQLNTLPFQANSVLSGLAQGQAGFQTGNNNNVYINLNGINRTSTVVPSDLKADNYGQLLLWQDRRNSTVKYTANGNIVCGNAALGCAKNSQELNDDNVTMANSPILHFKAGAQTRLNGIIYQPRGAIVNLQGGSGSSGPLKIITGGIAFTGNAVVTLEPNLGPSLTTLVAALVE